MMTIMMTMTSTAHTRPGNVFMFLARLRRMHGLASLVTVAVVLALALSPAAADNRRLRAHTRTQQAATLRAEAEAQTHAEMKTATEADLQEATHARLGGTPMGVTFLDSLGVQWVPPKTQEFENSLKGKWIFAHISAAETARIPRYRSAPTKTVHAWGTPNDPEVVTVRYPPQYVVHPAATRTAAFYHSSNALLNWNAGGAMRLEPLWITPDAQQSFTAPNGNGALYAYEVKVKRSLRLFPLPSCATTGARLLREEAVRVGVQAPANGRPLFDQTLMSLGAGPGTNPRADIIALCLRWAATQPAYDGWRSPWDQDEIMVCPHAVHNLAIRGKPQAANNLNVVDGGVRWDCQTNTVDGVFHAKTPTNVFYDPNVTPLPTTHPSHQMGGGEYACIDTTALNNAHNAFLANQVNGGLMMNAYLQANGLVAATTQAQAFPSTNPIKWIGLYSFAYQRLSIGTTFPWKYANEAFPSTTVEANKVFGKLSCTKQT